MGLSPTGRRNPRKGQLKGDVPPGKVSLKGVSEIATLVNVGLKGVHEVATPRKCLVKGSPGGQIIENVSLKGESEVTSLVKVGFKGMSLRPGGRNLRKCNLNERITRNGQIGPTP